MTSLFEAILKYVPEPKTDAEGPLQLQVSTLDYNSYVGRIGIGRIRRGTVKPGQNVVLRYGAEDKGSGKIAQVLAFKGLERGPVESASAGRHRRRHRHRGRQHRHHAVRPGECRRPAADLGG